MQQYSIGIHFPRLIKLEVQKDCLIDDRSRDRHMDLDDLLRLNVQALTMLVCF